MKNEPELIVSIEAGASICVWHGEDARNPLLEMDYFAACELTNQLLNALDDLKAFYGV